MSLVPRFLLPSYKNPGRTGASNTWGAGVHFRVADFLCQHSALKYMKKDKLGSGEEAKERSLER